MSAAALAFAAAGLAVFGLGLLAAGARRGRPRWVELLAALGSRAGAGHRAPRELEDRIAAAGRPGGLGVRELMAAKMAGAVLAGALGFALAAGAPARPGLLLALGSPVAGFLGPDLWLARLARERARAVRRDLPGMLDLLRVTVEAGASLPAALAAVGARSRGPLAAELRGLGRELALGVPLAEALEALAGRLPQPEVRALCGALERARRHGAPLASTLASQARDARAALRRRVREDAARAAPKIQLVVALMLVPSVLLLVIAALAAALLDGGLLPAG